MLYRMGIQRDCSKLTGLRIAYLLTDFGALSKEELTNLEQRLPTYYRRHIDKDLFVYIAEEEEVIVATAYLLIIEKPANPHFPTGKIGEVLSVYTKPEYRKRGLATKLMQELLSDAREKNLSYIELSATEDGYPLYKQLGFERYRSQDTEMRYFIAKKHE